jgi:hypothetical protein
MDEIINPTPETTQAEPEPVTQVEQEPKKSRKKTPEQIEATRKWNEQVKKIGTFYSLSRDLAIQKHSEFTDRGTLEEELEKIKKGTPFSGKFCPRCGSPMQKRMGRLGAFWGCTKYPNCNGTISIKSEIVKVAETMKEEMKQKTDIAMKYINEIGGMDEARRWLMIVAQILGEGKEDK